MTTPDGIPHKVCTVCKKDHPLTAYWKNRSYPDGLWKYCAACARVLRKNSTVSQENGGPGRNSAQALEARALLGKQHELEQTPQPAPDQTLEPDQSPVISPEDRQSMIAWVDAQTSLDRQPIPADVEGKLLAVGQSAPRSYNDLGITNDIPIPADALHAFYPLIHMNVGDSFAFNEDEFEQVMRALEVRVDKASRWHVSFFDLRCWRVR